MAEYGKEALEGKQLEAAKNFGFVTDHSNPDNSNPDNSWFTTVANAFSSIPKEHIFFATLLATSHAAHAYRHVTFNTPDNSNADNFDTENSNVVHHRSTRDEPPLPLGLTEVKLTLENGNCLLAQASTHKTIMQNIPWSKIFMQCYNTPCGEEYTQNEQTYNNWYHRVSNMKIEPVDDKTGKATFSYFDTRDMSMHQGEVTHSYNLPVSLSAKLSRDNNKQISEAHHHTLPNGNCMIVGESPQTPTTEFPNEWSRLYAKCLPESCNNQSFSSGENEANLSWGENLSDISIKPGKNNDTAEVFFMYYSSDNQFKSYSVEHVCDLPVLTPSIKESSSTATSTTPEKITETSLTSLITEASTPPEEITEAFIASLITEAIAKNTTQAESSTPTASQDQTTPSAEDQGWLWNKVVAPIAETAAVVVTTAVIAYALHKLRQCYNKNKTKETLDVERTNCDELSLLKIVDQIIPINDNGYTEVTKDLLGATETEDSCSVIA